MRSEQHRPLGRLSTRLALSLGSLILLTGLVAGVLLAVEDRRDRFAQAAARQQQAAAEFAARLSADMDERVQDVLLLAELEGFVESGSSRRSRILEQMAATDDSYAWIGVTDAVGVVEAASPSGMLQGADVSGRPWWQQGRDGLFLGDVHDALLLAELLAAEEQQPPRFVDISVPLVDDRGRTTGVLGVHLFWSWTEQLRAQVLNMRQADDGEVIIFDRDGRVLLPPAGTTLASAVPEPVERLEGAGRGVVEWTDGSYVTGWGPADAFGAFSGLGWTVVARRPAGLLTSHSLLLGGQIVAATVLAALLVAVVAWWRIRRATEQIREITVAAQQLRDGQDVAIPVLEGTREVAVLSAALRELTEHLASRSRALEQRNVQLAEASRAREQFTMMASHETRTPITVIRGALQTLRQHDGALPADTRVQLLEAAWRNTLRIDRLTSHMLAAAEVETGLLSGTDRRMGTVVPADLLSTLAWADVQIEGPHDLAVEVDSVLVELTVGNLFDNAAKYGEPPVHVTYWLQDGLLHVRVRDHGPGVPEDFTDQLFERYAQASQGLRRTAVGAGLGLWLSRQLLQAVGGDLVHQRPDGGGASFTASIPTAGLRADVRPSKLLDVSG